MFKTEWIIIVKYDYFLTLQNIPEIHDINGKVFKICDSAWSAFMNWVRSCLLQFTFRQIPISLDYLRLFLLFFPLYPSLQLSHGCDPPPRERVAPAREGLSAEGGHTRRKQSWVVLQPEQGKGGVQTTTPCSLHKCQGHEGQRETGLNDTKEAFNSARCPILVWILCSKEQN